MPVSTRGVSARLAGLGVFLPESTRSTAETERLLRSGNPRLRLATGLIHRMTGVETVHVRPEGWEASDLAVAAARQALADAEAHGTHRPVDLLIFASASQDLVEPATSHIVAAKLGLEVPVMDVKNACNSVVNAMQVADGLIRSGQSRRVLIASGEGPSVAVRWELRDHDEFIRSFPGYTMSDGGAALVMEADDSGESGILASRFLAVSRHWDVGTLPGGGTMRPHDADAAYFDMDGRALQQAFLELGPQPVLDLLADNGWTWDDFDLVAIHQVALPYLPPIFERLGVPDDRTVLTIAEHGNLASVTLPLQLQLARERGMVGPGSRVLLIGLAGGISLGLVAVVVTRQLAVVVPMLNEAAGIRPTLEALAAQRDADFDVVFVDNGSLDETVAIVEGFAAERGLGRWRVIRESQKGTGAAADTGMRAAIDAGAELLARTDADCLPRADWTAAVRRALSPRSEGGLGLRLVGGELVPRRDEGLGWPTRAVLRGAVHVAEAFGRVRSGNRSGEYLGPYMMAAGCNVGITAELYLAAGGFPRTKIEDLHEDRALVNAVRRITPEYARRSDVVVQGSSRRVRAWGLRNTLLWYKDHAYRPEHVDIR